MTGQRIPIPLSKRKYDIFFIIVFTSFFFIAIFMDYINAAAPAGSPKTGNGITKEWEDNTPWPPKIFVRIISFWCDIADPLLRYNPLWLKIMAIVSPFIYAPYYIYAVYCLIKGSDSIRTIGIAVSTAKIYSLIVILGEELYGEFPTPNVIYTFLAYGMYVLAPLLFIIRLLPSHPFTQPKQKSKKA